MYSRSGMTKLTIMYDNHRYDDLQVLGKVVEPLLMEVFGAYEDLHDFYVYQRQVTPTVDAFAVERDVSVTPSKVKRFSEQHQLGLERITNDTYLLRSLRAPVKK